MSGTATGRMPPSPGGAPHPAFAHASEAELARILDFYDVRWAYESATFPIGWSLDGEVVESFSPDFYLPDLEMFVELTTLKQSLVRKKNRKLRRLRELYPDVRIKLFYARDFRMLLLKFGRLALVDELSGATGQATPPRHPGARAGEADEAVGAGRDTVTDADGDDAAEAEAEVGADGGARAKGDGDAAADAEAPTVRDPATGRLSRGRRRGRRRRAGRAMIQPPADRQPYEVPPSPA